MMLGGPHGFKKYWAGVFDWLVAKPVRWVMRTLVLRPLKALVRWLSLQLQRFLRWFFRQLWRFIRWLGRQTVTLLRSRRVPGATPWRTSTPSFIFTPIPRQTDLIRLVQLSTKLDHSLDRAFILGNYSGIEFQRISKRFLWRLMISLLFVVMANWGPVTAWVRKIFLVTVKFADNLVSSGRIFIWEL